MIVPPPATQPTTAPAPRRTKYSAIENGLSDMRVQALVAKGLHHVEIAAALGCSSRVVQARLRVLRDLGLV